MKNYVETKMVNATPMNKYEFYMNIKGIDCKEENEHGYLVEYPDGYQRWSPKNVFEKACLQVGDDNKISEWNVNDFIKSYDVSQWGDKTTIVTATLANGFIITESSSCVDPANFSMDVGASICKEKIQDQVWEMLGFLLQTAVRGIK